MNEEIADAILESVQDVFQNFLAMELFVGVPQSNRGSGEQEAEIAGLPLAMETSALVGLTGAMRGAVILQSSRETASRLVGALTKRPPAPLNRVGLELFGELGDLIAGGIRSRLSSHGVLHIAPPQVVIGTHYALYNARIYSLARQTFRFPDGFFAVECHYLKDCA